MPKKKPTKSKSLDITLYPEKWRKLLSEFVERSDKKQTLREWCKERDLPESTAYKWLTASAVKAEEKLQANQRQISKKSTSRLPDDLPIRQAVFVEEYVTDFNGTNAAKRAGYSEKSAAKAAFDLRNKHEVRKAIGQRIVERMDGSFITTKEALAELASLAMANLADVADWSGGTVSLKDSVTLPRHISAAVAEVSQTKDGAKAKLHNKASSLKELLFVLNAKTEYEEYVKDEIITQWEKGEITAQQAAMRLFRHGIESPPALLAMINAELRLVEAPEDEIKPAPPKEAAISMQEYAAFVEWQKQQAQEKAAALVAKVEAEERAYNDGEA